MRGTSYPERALTAYFRELARKKRASLLLDDLPSRGCAATIDTRADVRVCQGSRIRAVYRMTPDGPLRRLQRWLKDLDLRPWSHGPPVAHASWEKREPWLRSPRAPSACPTPCWYDLCSGKGRAAAPTATVVGCGRRAPSCAGRLVRRPRRGCLPPLRLRGSTLVPLKVRGQCHNESLQRRCL
jgi:hypothetical protein